MIKSEAPGNFENTVPQRGLKSHSIGRFSPSVSWINEVLEKCSISTWSTLWTRPIFRWPTPFHQLENWWPTPYFCWPTPYFFWPTPLYFMTSPLLQKNLIMWRECGWLKFRSPQYVICRSSNNCRNNWICTLMKVVYEDVEEIATCEHSIWC